MAQRNSSPEPDPPLEREPVQPQALPRFAPKPPWLKVRAPGGDRYHALKETLRSLDLHTVCEEARCPNVGECWREGTATVMLLGDVCTRGCRFCAVTTGNPRGAVDPREPEHVARAIAKLELSYVVLTMVNRDDLLDGGAEHVGRTVRRLRELRSDILIETLVGDFNGVAESIDAAADVAPDVFAHNIETVERLTRTVRDVRSSYQQSLGVLRRAKERSRARAATEAAAADGASKNNLGGRLLPESTATGAGDSNLGRAMLTKSSIMVGLGESDAEVVQAMRDLRSAGVDVVTIGQYLRPSEKHHAVMRFVPPEAFAEYEREARAMGFLHASCGPLVRSSYKAAEVFLRSFLDPATDDVAATLEERLALARREAARVNAGADGELAPSGLVPASSLVRHRA